MSKSKSQLAKEQITCDSCGLLNHIINQCCPACGYIHGLSEEDQPKVLEPVEEREPVE